MVLRQSTDLPSARSIRANGMISLLCAAPHTQEKLRFGRGPGTNAEPSGSTSWGLGCHEGPVGRIFVQPKYCNRDETVSCADAPVAVPGRVRTPCETPVARPSRITVLRP